MGLVTYRVAISAREDIGEENERPDGLGRHHTRCRPKLFFRNLFFWQKEILLNKPDFFGVVSPPAKRTGCVKFVLVFFGLKTTDRGEICMDLFVIVQSDLYGNCFHDETFYGPFKAKEAKMWCEHFEERAKEVWLLDVRAQVTNINPVDDADYRYGGKCDVDTVIVDILRDFYSSFFDIGGEGG